jgi:hypothetical protein
MGVVLLYLGKVASLRRFPDGLVGQQAPSCIIPDPRLRSRTNTAAGNTPARDASKGWLQHRTHRAGVGEASAKI